MYDMPPGFRPEERLDDNGQPVTYAVNVKKEQRQKERDKAANQSMRAYDLFVALSLVVESWRPRELMKIAAWAAADEPEASQVDLLKKLKKMADGYDRDMYCGIRKLVGYDNK